MASMVISVECKKLVLTCGSAYPKHHLVVKTLRNVIFGSFSTILCSRSLMDEHDMYMYAKYAFLTGIRVFFV